MPFVRIQFFNNQGRPCAGCKLGTFVSGTNTPLASYSDALGIFPNANPTVADAAGRMNVFLTGSAYRLTLSDSFGNQLWSIDNITSSNLSLLASNNVWTGSNTFNGAVTFNTQPTFNVGLVSSGPTILNGGGTITGTWTGSPIFSGTPNFTGGIQVTNILMSGQLTSTIATGTPPFVIASTTKVTNLNVDLLDGCDWAIPCPIGTTTPNTAVFTTLQANTSFVLNGSTAQTGIQGTDTKLLTAGTVAAGAAHSFCTDGNGGATTTGCSSTGFTQIEAASISSPCSPPSGNSYDACNSTVTWPHAFADTSYMITCTAQGTGYNTGTPGNNNANFIYVNSQATGTASIIIQNGRGAADTPTKVMCIAVHP